MKNLLSVVILTKNEENAIIDCLESVVFANEIIVVDDFSTDRTSELVTSFAHTNIKVLHHRLDDDFSKQRNFGLKQAEGEWVLFVDADERVPFSLQEEISHIIKKENNIYNGYKIKRIDTMWGKRLLHGENGTLELVRLARKDKGLWFGFVHEQWNIMNPIGTLKTPLDHFPHQSISQFLSEINYYTDLRAKELYTVSVRSSLFSIIIYPLGKFIQNYILKQGYRDEVPGFIVALLMSFHSFLVRSKLWFIANSRS